MEGVAFVVSGRRHYLWLVTAANAWALVPVLASIALTAVNLWYQGYQETKRAERTKTERTEARTERLHEHWLDTKIDLYRRFLTSIREAEKLVDQRHHPAGMQYFGTPHARPGEYPTEKVNEIVELLEELLLVAPVDVSEAASGYMYTSLWYGDNVQLWGHVASEGGNVAAAARWSKEHQVNLQDRREARDKFRNLVRAELGLVPLEPSDKTEQILNEDPSEAKTPEGPAAGVSSIGFNP